MGSLFMNAARSAARTSLPSGWRRSESAATRQRKRSAARAERSRRREGSAARAEHSSRKSSCPRLAAVYGDVLHIAGTGVLALRADEAVVGELLEDVGRPAGDPGYREHRGEEVGGNAEAVVDGGGIEVHVGVEALLRTHERLDPLRQLVPPAVALDLAQLP